MILPESGCLRPGMLRFPDKALSTKTPHFRQSFSTSVFPVFSVQILWLRFPAKLLGTCEGGRNWQNHGGQNHKEDN
jgi:hypothetical protein